MPTSRAVLFVDYGNSCRSVMAQHLAWHFARSDGPFESAAAIEPQKGDDPARNALNALNRNFQVSVPVHIPKEVRSIGISRFDLVVAIDCPDHDEVFEKMKEHGCAVEKMVRWAIVDPWCSEDYDPVCRAIAERVRALLTPSLLTPRLLDSSTPDS